MNKRISRKTQCLLAVIPYLGFFLVFFMGAYQISKRKNRLYAVLFYLLSLIPIAVFLVIGVLALRFWVLPLENVALVVALSLIVMFVIMLCMCYLGYLWDALKDPVLISEEEILRRLSLQDRFYIMWDIHSKDYIYIPDYWKYPKKSVLLVTADEFRSIQHTLPEDIYLFDDSFCWTYVLTHEDLNGARFCLSFRE